MRDDFDTAFRELLAVRRVGIERQAAQRGEFLFEVVVREEKVSDGEARVAFGRCDADVGGHGEGSALGCSA